VETEKVVAELVEAEIALRQLVEVFAGKDRDAWAHS